MTLQTNQTTTERLSLSYQRIDRNTKPGFADTTQRLDFYELIWVKSGVIFLELNLKAYQIAEGTICCLAPGQIRRICLDNAGQVEYLKLAPDYFFRVCAEVKFPLTPVDAHHLGKPIIIKVKPDAEQELKDIIKKIKDLSAVEETPDLLLSIWLRLFMVYLKKHADPYVETGLHSREMELANEFLKLLAKNFATKKMVADYAHDLHVTPNYLNQIVKKVSGFSVSHHIQQYLILEAKKQALGSTRSMKQIAYALGFDDMAHFSKFFKSKSGTNFTEFKKSPVFMQL